MNKNIKFLVMGLSGSGKSFLCSEILKKMDLLYVNGDIIRKKYNDWDFSLEGRLRQAKRMADLLKEYGGIADFICPTEETRNIFNADYIIWMDTIKTCKYENTNEIFEKPNKVNLHIESWDYNVNEICEQMVKFTENFND